MFFFMSTAGFNGNDIIMKYFYGKKNGLFSFHIFIIPLDNRLMLFKFVGFVYSTKLPPAKYFNAFDSEILH